VRQLEDRLKNRLRPILRELHEQGPGDPDERARPAARKAPMSYAVAPSPNRMCA
jgi:hypothetical protein